MPRYSAEQVCEHPEVSARHARTRLEALAERFVIHFDVDVIDFMDFPIADVAQMNTGLTFHNAVACLKVFVASPQFAALVITECNPDHADEQGMLIQAFVQGIANVLGRQGD